MIRGSVGSDCCSTGLLYGLDVGQSWWGDSSLAAGIDVVGGGWMVASRTFYWLTSVVFGYAACDLRMFRRR
jgi:hypothetical protein